VKRERISPFEGGGFLAAKGRQKDGGCWLGRTVAMKGKRKLGATANIPKKLTTLARFAHCAATPFIRGISFLAYRLLAQTKIPLNQSLGGYRETKLNANQAYSASPSVIWRCTPKLCDLASLLIWSTTRRSSSISLKSVSRRNLPIWTVTTLRGEVVRDGSR